MQMPDTLWHVEVVGDDGDGDGGQMRLTGP